jgi:hypothetical protein
LDWPSTPAKWRSERVQLLVDLLSTKNTNTFLDIKLLPVTESRSAIRFEFLPNISALKKKTQGKEKNTHRRQFTTCVLKVNCYRNLRQICACSPPPPFPILFCCVAQAFVRVTCVMVKYGGGT